MHRTSSWKTIISFVIFLLVAFVIVRFPPRVLNMVKVEISEHDRLWAFIISVPYFLVASFGLKVSYEGFKVAPTFLAKVTMGCWIVFLIVFTAFCILFAVNLP